MYGSSFGYSSSTLERIARWALDLTFDFAPEVILSGLACGLVSCSYAAFSLFLKHCACSGELYCLVEAGRVQGTAVAIYPAIVARFGGAL